jgi:hypothetical protein
MMVLKARSVSGFSVRERGRLFSCRSFLLPDPGRKWPLTFGAVDLMLNRKCVNVTSGFVSSKVARQEHMRSCLIRYLL